jgi:hypothetical protein
MRKIGSLLLILVIAIVACQETPQGIGTAGEGGEIDLAAKKSLRATRIDPYFDPVNDFLKQSGASYRVAEVWMFTIGAGRPDNRILQLGTRWVPADPNRAAYSTGTEDLTYVIDLSDLTTDVAPAAAEQAIVNAFNTWSAVPHTFLDNVRVADDGGNYDFLDGVPADPFATCITGAGPFLPAPLGILDLAAGAPNADIITGGWLPREYFDCLVPDPSPGNGGGDFILGVTWTFFFVDGGGNPVDLNNDGHIDTAVKEIYYNDDFDWVTSGSVFLGNDIDIESVVLHENGHGMDLGHFGGPPPPLKIHPNTLRVFSPPAVMNPAYVGGDIRDLLPTDIAGFRALFSDGVGRQK